MIPKTRLPRILQSLVRDTGRRTTTTIALMLAAPWVAMGSRASDDGSTHAASDSRTPVAAAPAEAVRTLSDKTRTLVLEAAPACDVASTGDAAEAAPPLEVGAGALSLSVEFELGTARLAPGATRQLDALVATLKDPALAGAHFVVTGHTDSRGGDKVNIPLSCDRAKAVRGYLLGKGLAPERLEALGFGSQRPLAGLSPTDAANRRVEIRRVISAKDAS